MPIANDNTRVSIDFIYEFDVPDGETIRYQMKFQNTISGPTVTIGNGPYEPTELPADMFVEVAQFLVSQGAIKGATLPVVKNNTLTAGKVPLAMPHIGRKLGDAKSGVKAGETVQQISTNAAGIEQLETETSEEEQQQIDEMKKERLAAKAKNSTAKQIKLKE